MISFVSKGSVKEALAAFAVAVACLAVSQVFALYSRSDLMVFVRPACAVALLVSVWYRVRIAEKLRKRECVCLGAFSFLFSLAYIMGYHIVLSEGNGYGGLMADNYISAYTLFDLLALPCCWLFSYAVSAALFSLLARRVRGKRCVSRKKVDFGKIPFGLVAFFAACCFVLWIPYLLAYWPGFIFGDSIVSLSQALGLSGYSNHHPFVYTMFIKLCLAIAHSLGFGNTAGCVLYSVVQMAFMGLCFGYVGAWIKTRLNLGVLASVSALVAFASIPYIATYSVAMWKDPMFSAAVAALTPLVADFVFSKGSVLRSRKTWLMGFVVLLVAMVFLRSNGVYIALVLFLSLVVVGLCCLTKKCEWSKRGVFVLSSLVLVVVVGHSAITGPVYRAIGVSASPKVESYGVLLNQMARVAASGAEMSASDASYMDSLLPLDLYESTYRPCCADMLKWDPNFNGAMVNEEFLGHWLSMLWDNPVVYLESWELQTFGFWAVNVPEVNRADSNISGGMPRNFSNQEELDSLSIEASNKWGNDAFRQLFPWKECSVPLGWIHWALLYLGLCLSLLGKKSWLLIMVPSYALAATLIIASPIFYWPRYGAAVQFLIPFYAALIVLLTRAKAENENDEAAPGCSRSVGLATPD